jgi:tRNA A-37 threonylcarbamoyl transferase component Bud32
MQSDPTDIAIGGHPTLSELRQSAHPHIVEHLQSCTQCRAMVVAGDASGAVEPARNIEPEVSEPIPLDLPKGLVSETAFRWPADPMARGGMALIFAGEDRRLARSVILKSPRQGDELAPGVAETFERRVTAEARILAKLQHPSIVTIYELGKASVGFPFCVLEKVDGVSLRDRLDELLEDEATTGRPRTADRLELLSNLVAIAEALAYAHERRIVHRDCTPNNILLGKRGEATLIDWGIARDLDAPSGTSLLGGGSEPALDPGEAVAMTGVTISAGTPPYLPLEQVQGRKADPSFDVYSFGITLYEVVSGKPPFPWRQVSAPDARTKQLGAFLAWLKAGEPAAPAMPRDPELSGIIARAMASAAGDRFTADELVRALKQYLTGDLVFSHRYSAIGRVARWAGRNRAATVAVISLVLFAVGGALVWAQLSRRARHEADLQAIAAAARADASDKRRIADEATHEAEVAEQAADRAKQESKDADAMRREAERKRRIAEDKRGEFEQAATRAKDDADESFKRFTEAQKDRDEATRARDQAIAERDAARAAEQLAQRERDAARSAQLAADRDREAARSARELAEKERDTARASAAAAEADREAARSSASAAAQERDATRGAQQAAAQERDAAVGARASIERERDEARRRVTELEQRLHEPGPRSPGSRAPAPSPPPSSPPPQQQQQQQQQAQPPPPAPEATPDSPGPETRPR